MAERPLLRARAPAFAEELERTLREAGRPELADQVAGLRITALCACEVEGCASFSTVLPMKRWFRRGKLVPAGDLVVNTIDGEIAHVEVLGRPDVRGALRAE
ncbi:MAG TPA: hypothetical protein VH816_15120 [Gaiellaceae bacterium]|jgi:hypothetical protein